MTRRGPVQPALKPKALIEFHVVFNVHLDINFQILNQRMHFLIFVFLFNSPYICFGRDSTIIRGTLISSLHCSRFCDNPNWPREQ
jgi:hypothetical protein